MTQWVGAEDWIYLDYNASTPMAPEVIEVMTQSLQAQAHPSSKHPAGRLAAAAIEKAREMVAAAIEADEPEEIVFCSGSTEAANHVIKGIAFQERPTDEPLHFITSAVDHAATIEPLRFLERLGHQITILRVDSTGRLAPDAVEHAFQANTALVSLIHAQNEVGTVLPLAEIGDICRRRHILFHVDASQSFGKIPVSVNELKADFLQLAGHKIYAPKGVGALYVRRGLQLEPLLHGGGHERGSRSGTPAPALIAGLGEACRLVKQHGFISSDPSMRMWRVLQEQLGDQVVRNGHPSHRLPNVLHLTFAHSMGQELLEAARICASTGAACHSAVGSPVLQAMGFQGPQAAGSVRLSTGRDTTVEQAEEAALRLARAYRKGDPAVPIRSAKL